MQNDPPQGMRHLAVPHGSRDEKIRRYCAIRIGGLINRGHSFYYLSSGRHTIRWPASFPDPERGLVLRSNGRGAVALGR